MTILIAFILAIFAFFVLFLFFKSLEKRNVFKFSKEPSLPDQNKATDESNTSPSGDKSLTDADPNTLTLEHPKACRTNSNKVLFPAQAPSNLVVRLTCKENRKLSGPQILHTFKLYNLVSEKKGAYAHQRNGKSWFYVMNSEKPVNFPSHEKDIREFSTSGLMIYYEIPVPDENQNRVWAEIMLFCQKMITRLDLELRDSENKEISKANIKQYGLMIEHFFPENQN